MQLLTDPQLAHGTYPSLSEIFSILTPGNPPVNRHGRSWAGRWGGMAANCLGGLLWCPYPESRSLCFGVAHPGLPVGWPGSVTLSRRYGYPGIAPQHMNRVTARLILNTFKLLERIEPGHWVQSAAWGIVSNNGRFWSACRPYPLEGGATIRILESNSSCHACESFRGMLPLRAPDRRPRKENPQCLDWN